MEFQIQKDLIKKYSPLIFSLCLGLLFFNIMFTLIRKYYYGATPVLQEYIFPLLMGILFGGGIGLWRIQYREYKREIEKTLNELKESNELLSRTNSELSETQQKLNHSQKMELVGLIASGVAHDLNNVLGASVSYPEILILKYSNDTRLCNYLQRIKQSGLKAAAMVQDLLTLARRGVSVEKVLNINNIVQECVTSPEYEKIKLYHPGVRLKLKLAEDIQNIIGSPLHVMKAIINLLSNAAEAMPNGGTLSIQSFTCSLKNKIKGYEIIPAGTYSILSVKDTGIGIPEKDLKKIFEPFYTKKEMGRSGTGLGMAVIWSTVKDHHGYIDVGSIEGQGTTFSLYFPVTDRQLDIIGPQQLNVGEYKGNGELILVVDDIEDQRKIAKSMLSFLGYSVITASNGENAVEYLKNNKPALVLMDMVMSPGIDGLETYKRMLKYNPQQKSLIVSGYSENERVKESIRLGAGKYLKKPYTLEILGNAIRDELIKTGINKCN